MARIIGGMGTSYVPTIGVAHDKGCRLCAIDVLDVYGQIDRRDVFLADRPVRDGKRLRTRGSSIA